MLVLGLAGKFPSSDIPHYPEPQFFAMLALIGAIAPISVFLLTGRPERLGRVSLWSVYAIGATSLVFIAVGLLTGNRLTGQETRIGALWITMAVLYRILILLKDLQIKRLWIFGAL